MKKIGTVFMSTLLILDGIFGGTDIQAATLNKLNQKEQQNTIYTRLSTSVEKMFMELLSIEEIVEISAPKDMENGNVVSGSGVTTGGGVEDAPGASMPTEAPSCAVTPETTNVPGIATIKPSVLPVETGKPETPNITKMPIATSAPNITKMPIPTQAPVVSIVTKEPEKTIIPIITVTPTVFMTPDVIITTGTAVCATATADIAVNKSTAKPSSTTTSSPESSPMPEVVYCSVHYKLNGGTNASGNPSKVYASAASYRLKAPKRKGYTFQGWYLESSFKHRVYYVQPNGASSVTYYAKWKIVTVQKVKITSAKRLKSGKIRVKVGNHSGVDGYEYVYSLTSSMAKKSLVRSVKNPKDLTKLKKNVRYYIKVRCYKYDSWGRKIYGSYSKVVKCK